MRNRILIVFILAVFSCTNHPAKAPEETPIDTTNLPAYERYKEDSVIADDEEKVTFVIAGEDDTIEYTRSEYAALKKAILVDSDGLIVSPDDSFLQNEFFVYKDSTGRQLTRPFGSEVGQDFYFETYAWFLMERNGIEKYKVRRKKAVETFRTVNEIFDILRLGGTYYGHQYRRILGYAEYSIYKYKSNPKDYSKKEGFAYAKKAFIDSLRQVIAREINSETSVPKDELVKRYHYLLKKVNELDKQISDYFYLREAGEFLDRSYPERG
jgi:hypothetical protein